MEIEKKSSMENNKKTIKYNGVKAMPFVIGNETFEKLGTIGTSHNLLVYLTNVFHMNNMTATNVLNIFSGSANLATLLGAYLCDTYFGRYKTLGFATVASFVGLLFLTLTAVIPGLHPPHCEASGGIIENCIEPTKGQLAFLIGGLVFLIMGAGGIRPCNLAFGADQFDPNSESGKRGVSSFFNWYYFTFTFAMMVSVTVVVYIQTDIGWGIGLAIPAIFMFLSSVFFFIGTKLYVMVEPQGSPLTSVVQVLVAAVKKRGLELPEEKLSGISLFDHVPEDSINSKFPHTNQFRCLDKAAIVTDEDKINPEGSAANPWKLSSLQQVEQVKCVIRVLPIWICGIIYNVSSVNTGNYTVFEAIQSDRNLGINNFMIPPASYSIFTMLAITIWIPIYDRLIVPKLRKITGKENGITVLQKVGIGIVIMIITLIVFGLVENRRREIALTKPALAIDPKRGAISSFSAMWFVLPLTLSGLSEAFTLIGFVEFYYKQFPENMRSIGGAFLFCGMALSSYLSSFLQSCVDKMTRGSKMGSWLKEDLNKGRLDYFYYLIAGIQVVNFFLFLVCAKWYRYRETIISETCTKEKNSELVIV